MSNFMRYLLYRSKDFEIASVDKLINPADYNRIYFNRNHKFYIGDITDEYFMDRLIAIEKPDWIINGIGYFSIEEHKRIELHTKNIINSAILLSKYGIPTIQLSHTDKYGYNFVSSQFTLKNGIMLVLPNCFGMRQKYTAGLAQLIWSIKELGEVYVHEQYLPWVYAEDVASLIWYIIEKNFRGGAWMPALGFMNLKTMANIVCSELGMNAKFIEVEDISKYWEPLCYQYSKYEIDGWEPDSVSLEDAIKKTISWYKANKWAL